MSAAERKPVSIVLSGIGGYGYHYLRALLDEFSPSKVELRAVVDPEFEKREAFDEIRQRKIPIYTDMDDFFKHDSAELAVISSPIHQHVPQSLAALNAGCNVLCEKPVCAAIQDVDRLIEASKRSGRFVYIGYQWSYSSAVQALKRDIMLGVFGAPLRLRLICCWCRNDFYYERNDWAGRIKSADGAWVLDSPANNAMAHFLHFMLYILGNEIHLSAVPAEICAEAFRANPIENYDTVACRVRMLDGPELLCYFSHATRDDHGPKFILEFEDAEMRISRRPWRIVITRGRHARYRYGSPDSDHQFRKLFEAVRAARDDIPAVCTAETARSQTLCIDGIQDSIASVVEFPRSVLKRDNMHKRWLAEGSDDMLNKCFSKAVLPSETGVPWAERGKIVDLTNYTYYPGGSAPQDPVGC